MGAFKPWHWIVLLIVILLVFGAGKLPEIASSLGQSMKVFKKEVKELREDDAPAQIQQPQQGTYYTQPTQPGQAASQPQQNAEGANQQ
ncbi:Sec-independent protein translocase subunit TatA [Actinomyces gaoshouyii]|uniref:Sec-independent protein translocase subunit TatA n=1 Tax=Actinomyces gaoshouyii TaxID=1960083 RepID=UPI0009BCCD87|nr:Sec-independent protein translocase subunit TatA [Actinomyces gaoshouyii]ARD41688.1 Sec-independent protein translocase TatA [Actinomyces gaoshouyii]